jgi:predicted RNase H-like HicB family nuclease
MSDKSKKLNKPFDRKILAGARKIAEKYEVIMTFEDGQWFGRGLEMATVFGGGKTPNQCVENTRQALVAAVAHLLERGESAPPPACEGRRTEQVNVRLTAEEKVILTAAAKSKGYRGLGDYLRANALTIMTHH